MFGISESNIIDRGNENRPIGNAETPIVRLSYNQTIPNMIRDGVDSVSVYTESKNLYRVEYGGYLTGYFILTLEGVQELVDSLLGGQSEISHWVIRQDIDQLPDWISNEYPTPEPVSCDKCGADVNVTNIVTPLLDGKSGRYCPDCWKSVQEKL